MIHNFDKVINRRNTNSLKWDVKNDELPMWVADMDFQTAPKIIETIHKKTDLGIFGYTIIPDEYYFSILHWWKHRHEFQMEKDWIFFCTGVVPAISSIIRKMTTVGENVLILSPVYNIFYNSITNNGRNIMPSNLLYDGKEYNIDFADLENKLSNPQTTLMLLCNPHNPIGKIWDVKTLERIGDLCDKYNVLVVSDEIHCDLTMPNEKYIPFASINNTCANNSITCISASKAFNLAGLQTASVVIPNPIIRHKVNRGLNTDEIAEPNVFAIEATIAAFTYGESWLNELRSYIQLNKELSISFLSTHIPQLHVISSKATYLLWIDCTAITKDTDKLCDFIRENTGLYLSSGSVYGNNGNGFIRMNIACPKQPLQEGLHRFEKGINKFLENEKNL